MFILGLALTPCSDVKTCDEEQLSFLEHDHSGDTEDTCTPFCACQCCGSNINVLDLARLDIQDTKTVFYYNDIYSFNYKLDHVQTVWHPPIFMSPIS